MNTLKTLPDGNIQITIDYVFVKRSGRKQIVMKEDRENPENLEISPEICPGPGESSLRKQKMRKSTFLVFFRIFVI